MTTPDLFGIGDNFGEGGKDLAPDGASGPVANSLREKLRTLFGSIWAGYADTTALTASLAKNRAAQQVTVLADGSLWIWKPLDSTAADATHIAPTDVGVGAGRWVAFGTAGTAPSLKGTTTLVAGVSPAVSSPNLTATSRIVVTRRDAGASTAIGSLACKNADRVTGAGGTFKVTSQKSDATTETNDVSTVDWIIFL